MSDTIKTLVRYDIKGKIYIHDVSKKTGNEICRYIENSKERWIQCKYDKETIENIQLLPTLYWYH